jgi:hypothetical protein
MMYVTFVYHVSNLVLMEEFYDAALKPRQRTLTFELNRLSAKARAALAYNLPVDDDSPVIPAFMKDGIPAVSIPIPLVYYSSETDVWSQKRQECWKFLEFLDATPNLEELEEALIQKVMPSFQEFAYRSAFDRDKLSPVWLVAKAEWIKAHGSALRRRAFGLGYACEEQYLLQRARMELPGFILDYHGEINRGSKWSKVDIPPVEALDLEEALLAAGYKDSARLPSKSRSKTRQAGN